MQYFCRSGNGTAVFATENEDLRPKVMSQLKNALQPSLTDVEVVWTGVDDDDEATAGTFSGLWKPKPKLEPKKFSAFGQAPTQIAPIFDGKRLLVYKLFQPRTDSRVPKSVKVTAQSPNGPLVFEIAVEEKSLINGDFVHQMAARKRIQELEEGGCDPDATEKEIEDAIVELGLKFGLASKHTSFVGVDEVKPDGKPEPIMITR